jgi:hypothetical protein
MDKKLFLLAELDDDTQMKMNNRGASPAVSKISP